VNFHFSHSYLISLGDIKSIPEPTMAASTDAVMADIGEVRAQLGSLPNELLNLITDLVVAGGTPMAVMRLVNKRFKACAQSHLVESLQAKVCTSPASTQAKISSGTIGSADIDISL